MWSKFNVNLISHPSWNQRRMGFWSKHMLMIIDKIGYYNVVFISFGKFLYIGSLKYNYLPAQCL